ncbi:hypothetical protein ACJX0J_035449, partial [Zea mays]
KISSFIIYFSWFSKFEIQFIETIWVGQLFIVIVYDLILHIVPINIGNFLFIYVPSVLFSAIRSFGELNSNLALTLQYLLMLKHMIALALLEVKVLLHHHSFNKLDTPSGQIKLLHAPAISRLPLLVLVNCINCNAKPYTALVMYAKIG